MSETQAQILWDEKMIRELRQEIERLKNAVRIERLRNYSLRLQLEGRPQRPAMTINL